MKKNYETTDKTTKEEHCDVYALKNIGVKGTASPLSVLNLLENEERERKRCLAKIDEKTKRKN